MTNTEKRLARIESRLCQLMLHMGVDPQAVNIQSPIIPAKVWNFPLPPLVG
jgi:hypothetical protein